MLPRLERQLLPLVQQPLPVNNHGDWHRRLFYKRVIEQKLLAIGGRLVSESVPQDGADPEQGFWFAGANLFRRFVHKNRHQLAAA